MERLLEASNRGNIGALTVVVMAMATSVVLIGLAMSTAMRHEHEAWESGLSIPPGLMSDVSRQAPFETI